MVIDDFIDEFYAFDIKSWADSLEDVLHMLNFPIRLEYKYEWREFLYERLDRIHYYNAYDRKLLAECQGIVTFSLNGRFSGIPIVSVLLTGDSCLRNEKACNIYKVFRKAYGQFLIFIACFNRDIAFVGTSMDNRNRTEVIISDWFGEKTNREVMNRMLEIDCSLFSLDSFGEFYGDYLWAIARPYEKYRESKTFLTFGCGYVKTDEDFIPDEKYGFMHENRVDREETYRYNSAYYPKLYGDDYYDDGFDTEEDSVGLFDEEDEEFEWTMLELELDDEDIDGYDDYEELFEDEGRMYDSETEEYDEISGMNPEEMLSYIHSRRA